MENTLVLFINLPSSHIFCRWQFCVAFRNPFKIHLFFFRQTQQGAEGIEDYCEDRSASLLRSPKCSTAPGSCGFFLGGLDSLVNFFWHVLVSRISKPVSYVAGPANLRRMEAYKVRSLAFLSVSTILETRNLRFM